jgi:hypothetical protein
MSVEDKCFGLFAVEMSKNQEQTIDLTYAFTSFISKDFDKIVRFGKTRL